MTDTLPRALTPGLLDFCRSISLKRPRFIPSRPAKDALPSSCFDNVSRKIGRAGGGTAYGWAVWHMRGLYFEAEHHGVWRNRKHDLVDVSPQPGGSSRILFLPDPTAVYDSARFRSNVMRPDGYGALAEEFVGLANRRGEILDGCRAGGRSAFVMTIAHQMELAVLAIRMGALLETPRTG